MRCLYREVGLHTLATPLWPREPLVENTPHAGGLHEEPVGVV
jgi:hypothetical protein